MGATPDKTKSARVRQSPGSGPPYGHPRAAPIPPRHLPFRPKKPLQPAQAPRRLRRRSPLFQKLKDSFIDHRRLYKGQIVASALNYLSRDLGSHSLQATHGLPGRVNDLVLTCQEQRGDPQTSPFGIGQHRRDRSLVPLNAPHVQRQLLDRRVNPLRIRSRHIRKDPSKKRWQAPLSGDTERDQPHPELGRGPQNSRTGREEDYLLEALWSMQCILSCQRSAVRHANKADPLSHFQCLDEFIQPRDEVMERPDRLGANTLAKLSDLVDRYRSVFPG